MFFKHREKTETAEVSEIAEKKEKTPLTKEQKKKIRKRILIGGAAVILLGAMILPKIFAPEVLPQVSVATVKKGEVAQTIEGSGTIKSEEIKTYFSPVTATVDQFHLKVGDLVKEGDMLLTYNEKELGQLYKQAELTGSVATYGYQDKMTQNSENEAEYARSQDAVNVLKNSIEKEKNEAEEAQDQITKYNGRQGDIQAEMSGYQAAASDAQAQIDRMNGEKAALPTEIANLEAQMRDLETQINNLKEQLGKPQDQTGTQPEGNVQLEEELKKLEEDLIVANAKKEELLAKPAQLDQAIAEQTAVRDEALAAVGDLQGELNSVAEKISDQEERLQESAEETQRLETWKAKEEGIKDSSEAAILSNEAKNQLAADQQLSSLNVLMTKEDIQAGKKGISAEFSGVVTEVTAVAGGPAAKGGSLFSVASNERVVVDMPVTRYDLEKLEIGQSAEITVAGKSYSGAVSKLSRLAAANEKGTPVVSAEIQIEGADENIYLGLEAKVKIHGHEANDVLVVPVETVNTGKDGSFCYVVENGVVVKKEVETGITSAATVEIKSGLTEGAKVIRIGAELIEEGMKVTAVEE